METRTDIHRPSSEDFDPEAYQCWGVYDNYPDWPNPAERQNRREQLDFLRNLGYTLGAGSSGQCGHCGAAIRYAALMVRADVKEFIWVGEICLWGRFESLTKIEFQELRKAAKLNREREAKRDLLAKFYDDHPLLVWLSYYFDIEDANTNRTTFSDDGKPSGGDLAWWAWYDSFLADLAWQLARKGELSEKQVAAAEKALVRDTERHDQELARKVVQDQEKADLVTNGVKVPEGRVVIEGEVISVKCYDGYMPGTSVIKITVKSDEGWRVWGSEPTFQDRNGVEKGDRIRFTATVIPSEDDQLFGKFKRPAKAEVL